MGAELKLHLGVIDQPYQNGTGPTTGDVAGYLETKYHPMEVFAELHMEDVIVKALTDSLHGELENILLGAPPGADPFAQVTQDVPTAFRAFISNAEMDHLGYPGVPTQAALDGVTGRTKSKRGEPRPSFRDTGTYMNSMTAWVEE